MKPKSMPVRAEMCATCPFREGSPTAYLRAHLIESALEQARICHSTGKNNAFHKRTGNPEAICRGARDFQLQVMAAAGVIKEPTDAAWNAKCREIGIVPNKK